MNNENKNVETVETNDNTTNTEHTVTMSQAEFDKKIQGEGDRVRTEYSKKIKELETKNKGLESKIKELTPTQKTEAEIDFEKRLAALEAKEKKLALLDSLNAAGVSKDLIDYLKNDVDIDAFSKVYKSAIDNEIQKRVKSNGYVPNSHKSGESITKEDFAKMNMTDKEQLFSENPELYRTLVGR